VGYTPHEGDEAKSLKMASMFLKEEKFSTNWYNFILCLSFSQSSENALES